MSPDGPPPPRPRDRRLADRITDIRWSPLSAPATGTLWVGEAASGRVVLKQATSRRGFDQERHALHALAGHRVPALLGADPATRLLLLAHVPGAPPAPGDPAAHAAAGAWLRRLHDRPAPEDDPLPLAEALTRRARAALARAASTAPVATAIRVGLQPDAPFPAAVRVWCHRDLTPRNWLWDADQGLHVVDLEHSRPDHPAWDLVKLATEVWPDHPAARAAFADTYGPLPDPGLLRRLGFLHGLQTRTWGRAHGDPVYTALGERILDRLSGTPSPG
jgi:hypothetical protein